MKLIKFVIILVVLVLVLNYFGLLTPEFSRKVDNAVENTLTKINSIKYKGKLLTEMSIKEISTNVSKDISYLKEEVVTKDGVKFSNKGVVVVLTPGENKVLEAQVDLSNDAAKESVEKLINNLTGISYKVPEDFRIGQATISVEKNSTGEYEVTFEK